MHARSFRSRSAAKASVRPQPRIIKAFTSVLESLERRALLSAGDPMGTFTTDLGGSPDVGGQVFRVPGPDQKLLQVGTTSNLDVATMFALAQFNADGSSDTGFGVNGQVTAALPTEFTDNDGDVYSITAVNAVAVDPTSGRIILVGTADNGT